MRIFPWGGGWISASSVCKSFFPITFNQYWFATAYAILFLFGNYINRMLTSLSEHELLKLLVIIMVIWCIIPTITFQVKDGLNWTQQIWVFCMYIFGASIRLLDVRFKGIKLWISAMALNLVFILSPVVLEFVGLRYPIASSHATYFRWSNSIIAVPVTLIIFYVILSFRPFKLKYVNKIASCTMGVYLFHEHPGISLYLWNLFGCDPGNSLSNYSIVLRLFVSVMVFFTAGIMLQFLFEFIYRFILDCLAHWRFYNKSRR